LKHIWNVSTSPRTPSKIKAELAALQPYHGKTWDREAQRQFTETLKTLKNFEGQGSTGNETFTARDRVKGMKTYGFVFHDRPTHILTITPAGMALIASTPAEEQEIFLRQLLKWQFPSPQHSDSDYAVRNMFGVRGFDLKPLILVMRVAKGVGGITKFEAAMAVLPTIKTSYANKVMLFIRDTRALIASLRPGVSRKQFRKLALRVVYENLSATPKSGLDYADALFRLMRHTGLFTIDGNRLVIAPARADDVDKILAITWPLRKDWDDGRSFYAYFGAAGTPKLPWDDAPLLRVRVRTVIARIEELSATWPAVNAAVRAQLPTAPEIDAANVATLKTIFASLDDLLRQAGLASLIGQLRTPSGMSEVAQHFDRILDRDDDVYDPPMQLEWNLWRAILALDHTDKVFGNFTMDSNLQPMTRAGGNQADGVANFDEFAVLLEATLLSGRTQFARETEPVVFHTAKQIAKLRAAGDLRPVYTLCVAPSIHINSAQYFLNTAKGVVPVPDLEEPALVVPLSISQVKALLIGRAGRGPFQQADIAGFFSAVETAARETTNASLWLQSITQEVERLAAPEVEPAA